MDLPERHKHTALLFAECVRTLESKGADYSPEEGAFEDFERAAEDLALLPEEILWVYLTKHLQALRAYLVQLRTDAGDSRPSPPDPGAEVVGRIPREHSEPIRGRIVDAINYLAILDAMRANRCTADPSSDTLPPAA
jgi:hypothetical protein